jgi:glutathione S-transferase
VPYDVRVHYRTQGWFAGSTLRDVSALGKSPAVQLDDTVLTESGAILSTLMRTFPGAATEPEPSPDSLFWSHFSEGSLMLYLQPARFATLGMREVLADEGLSRDTVRGVKMMNEWFQAWARKHATGALGEAERWLAGHELFSGSERLGLGDVSAPWPSLHSS